MALCPPWSGPFAHASTKAITGLPLANSLKNAVREKRWCYAGVVSPKLFFGAAVIHLGYITSGFAFGFDRETGQMTEQTLTWPPLGHLRYDRNPEQGTCRFKGLGQHIEILSLPDRMGKAIRVRLKRRGQTLTANLTLAPPATGFSVMHFPMDMGAGKHAFTTKAAGLIGHGSVTLNSKDFFLAPKDTFGLYDWTHGAYPRHTFWNWACGAGTAKTVHGHPVALGFNFSRGVYENGRLENTLWIDGRPEPVPAIDFKYHAPEAPWQITSADRRVALTFFSEGFRAANDNFIALASRFTQPCGRFNGEVTTLDGRRFTLSSVSGVVEEHDAKW